MDLGRAFIAKAQWPRPSGLMKHARRAAAAVSDSGTGTAPAVGGTPARGMPPADSEAFGKGPY